MHRSNNHNIIPRMLQDMGPDRPLFLAALVIMAGARLCLAYAPTVIEGITDTLQTAVTAGNVRPAQIVPACILLALLYLAGNGADILVNRILVRICERLAQGYRDRAAHKLNVLPIRYLDNHPAGDTLSRLTSDIQAMTSGVESTLPALIGQAVLLVATCVMMGITEIRLACIYYIVLPVLFCLTAVLVNRVGRYFRAVNEQLGAINAEVNDCYRNHMIIRSYDCAEEKRARFDELNARYQRLYQRSRFLNGFMIPIGTLAGKTAYVCLCVVGGIMMVRGDLSLGQFTAFLFYGDMVTTPLSSSMSSLATLQDSFASAARVYELLDEEEIPTEHPTAQIDVDSVRGEVAFRQVRFGYTEDRVLMQNVTYTARPGEVFAIVGPSGAGKTTLVNLLMRFYEIQGGQITVDGVDAAEMSKENLRACIGMVLQDSWICDGTVADNIGYGRPGASRKEIEAAAQTACCDAMIRHLPQGYDTHISEENCPLSSGERQLLCIARAVLADRRILVLDEATSQVDTRTEALINKAMSRMMEGRTTFIIAHRLYTIRNADQILYMENGDIKEIGSHDELMARNGRYAALYRSGYEEE